MEKVVILGTGIAGLTAGVYTARANLEPLIVGGPEEGGQLTLTTDVENFPGFPEGVQGPELVKLARKQAERFGAKYKTGICKAIEKKDKHFILTINEEKIEAQAVIVATGASARWLGLESEKKYKGRGVTTCATCDGAFFKGKEVVVIGGGDSAMEESQFLTKFVTKVTVIHRRDKLRASKIMQDRFFKNKKCNVIWDSVVEEIVGDGKRVTAVKLKSTKDNKTTEFKCDGVFLTIGHIPNTKFLVDKVKLDDHKYLICDRWMHTSMEGVFGAGDVQDTKYRQAITAAGTGCQAAMEVEKYLESLE